jgi:glycosyltransferase involved in cell wall biosynthesis
LIAGSFDDIGAPFFGVVGQPGSFYYAWKKSVEAAEKKAPLLSVRYLGMLSSHELRKLYAASDLFVSLSLHHDEDFGMSPAEALACGTPALLSSWGGYSSFQGNTGVGVFDCALASVKITKSGLEISHSDIQHALWRKSFSSEDARIRKNRSEHYHSRFSIRQVSKQIFRVHENEPPRFGGFSVIHRQLAKQFSKPVLFPKGPTQGTLYEKIYKPYTR